MGEVAFDPFDAGSNQGCDDGLERLAVITVVEPRREARIPPAVSDQIAVERTV